MTSGVALTFITLTSAGGTIFVVITSLSELAIYVKHKQSSRSIYTPGQIFCFRPLTTEIVAVKKRAEPGILTQESSDSSEGHDTLKS